MLCLSTQAALDGNIDFKGAYFSYPTRREMTVLRDLNLSVEQVCPINHGFQKKLGMTDHTFQGKNVALVGTSGCGKSTCIQLLQRFYDLRAGELVSHVFIYIQPVRPCI